MTAIGILGGTFNPIHNGHLAIAKAAYEQYMLDEVWFMPNHIPDYKNNSELIDGKIRLHMAELATKNYPYFKVSDYELNRAGKTYTAQTMQLLSKDYPDVIFYFIIGADSLDYFDRWKDPEVILTHAKILAAPRENSSKDSMNRRICELHKKFGANHFFPIECEKIICSSSEIREQLSKYSLEDMNAMDFVSTARQLCIDPEVLRYIIKHHLYRV